MAASILPAPGSKYGPCKEDCGHRDCKNTRDMAGTPCGICGEKVGYNRAFYNDGKYGLVHAVCLEEKIEQEKVDEAPLDVYKWCDDNILESAEKDGLIRELITRNLDRFDKVTKSPRIMRLIRIAYWRGCRRGVDMATGRLICILALPKIQRIARCYKWESAI